MDHRHILLLADMEGSSLCFDRDGAGFLTRAWAHACYGMSADAAAVVSALFDAGVEKVTVKDFHRTGWNLFPEFIDRRAYVVQGFRMGPVPGIGDPGDATGVIFLGMHAPSGTDGFLPHTLTSRLAAVEVNGCLIGEVELFASSLAPFGLRPLLFSGCPVACRHAKKAIEGLETHPIPKGGPDGASFQPEPWRLELAEAAAASLRNNGARLYLPEGPFKGVVTLREGPEAARRLARRWGFARDGSRIFLLAPDIHGFYRQLLQLVYFTPLMEKTLPVALFFYNLIGRAGLAWARRCLKKKSDSTPQGGA